MALRLLIFPSMFSCLFKSRFSHFQCFANADSIQLWFHVILDLLLWVALKHHVFNKYLQCTCKQQILHHSHHRLCWFHKGRGCKGTGGRRCRPGRRPPPEGRAARAPWCLIRPGAKPALRRLETERVRWAPPVSGEPDPPTPLLGQPLVDQPQSGLIFYLPGLTRLCKADTSYDKI